MSNKIDDATANKMGQMVGPAMRLMDELTKDIIAKNVVSEFVENHIGDLFNGDAEMAAGFLVKAMMDDANKNPKATLETLLKFYNDFRVFYTGLIQAQRIEDKINNELMKIEQ